MATKKAPLRKKKKWSEMTKAEKRVAVAKDVLKLLNEKKITAIVGEYVDVRLPKGVSLTADIKSNFEKVKKCRVCAMGACLLSITRFENKLNFNDVGRDIYYMNNDKTKKLFSLFAPEQLILIEQAFEGFSYDAHRIASKLFNIEQYSESQRETEDSCNGFHDEYTRDKERLIAIMNNIIANKGTFKL